MGSALASISSGDLTPHPNPAGVAHPHCATLKLSDIVTQADMEEALVRAWTCVQEHNIDKDDLERL